MTTAAASALGKTTGNESGGKKLEKETVSAETLDFLKVTLIVVCPLVLTCHIPQPKEIVIVTFLPFSELSIRTQDTPSQENNLL